MSERLIVVLIALLMGAQPIATDLYLPALPTLTTHLGASMAQGQLTLTAMLLAFGLSQLIWGPISDRFGRKPVLLAGLSVYTLAAIASSLANDINTLIACRVAQGASMGAGVMCARAIVRDMYLPVQGARVASKAYSVLGLLIGVTMPVGAVMAQWWGWRIPFVAVAVFGASSLFVVATRYTESLKSPNPRALEPQTLLRTWRSILTNPVFLAFTCLTVTTYCGLFTFLAASSFVFLQILKMSPAEYGLWMCTMVFFYVPGTFLCRSLLQKYGVRRTIAIGGAISLTGGTLMALLAWWGFVHPLALMGPFWIYMVGHGIHQACGQSGAVGPFPQAAGAASAMNGFLMMAVAFCIGLWLGRNLGDSVQPMAYGVWFWSVLLVLTAWTLIQRHGASATPGPAADIAVPAPLGAARVET